MQSKTDKNLPACLPQINKNQRWKLIINICNGAIGMLVTRGNRSWCGGSGVSTPQHFYWPPNFGQLFSWGVGLALLHNYIAIKWIISRFALQLYTDWTIWSSKFQKFSGEGLPSQARSQLQNSKGAQTTSKGAHNLHPKKVVTKSPSQPITARESGERCKLPQRGLGRSPSR